MVNLYILLPSSPFRMECLRWFASTSLVTTIPSLRCLTMIIVWFSALLPTAVNLSFFTTMKRKSKEVAAGKVWVSAQLLSVQKFQRFF